MFNDCRAVVYKLIQIISDSRVCVMRLIDEQRKLWLDRRSRKGQLSHSKKRKRKLHKKLTQNNSGQYPKLETEINVLGNVPEVFSIKRDFEKTASYFHRLRISESKLRKKGITIDFSITEKIGMGALIYLLAFLDRFKMWSKRDVKIILPYAEEPKKRIIESGFINIIETQDSLPNTWQIDTGHIFQISKGDIVNPKLVKSVCIYVQNSLNLLAENTYPLYEILIELMSNSISHSKTNCWYLYAEKKSNMVDFVFLDAGIGIPSTIHKNFRERVLKVFSSEKVNDSKLIESALNGEFRTRTKKGYRGKGLPQIAKNLKSDLICNWVIYSGHARCEADKSDPNIIKFNLSDYKKLFHGTLFCWGVVTMKGDITNA